MMDLRAGSLGAVNVADIFVDGALCKRVTRVFVLWNGGPGIVWYAPVDVRGHAFLTDRGDGIATAFRFGWRVRITFRNVGRVGEAT